MGHLARTPRLALLLFALSLGGAPAAVARDFTVDRTGDQPDLSAADGNCDISGTASDGIQCTLRAAIQQANVNGEPDAIRFDPALFAGTPGGVNRIVLGSSLPAITETVEIDGRGCFVSAGGPPRPCVEIWGQDDQVALRVSAGGDSTYIRGISIWGANSQEVFGTAVAGKGIVFDREVTGGGVQASWIGLPLHETATLSPFNGYGIEVLGDEIEIGGSTAGLRNNVTFNSAAGVKVTGDANGTVIRGNDFGVGSDGQTDLFNSVDAIEVSGFDPNGQEEPRVPTDTLIGGDILPGFRDLTCDNDCNVIVNTGQNGVGIDLHGDGTLGTPFTDPEVPAGSTHIGGNYVGLKKFGLAVGNGGTGILVGDADDVTIGGPSDGLRNWFARNANTVGGGGIQAFQGAEGLAIENNWIGKRPNGNPAPDRSFGVDLGAGTVKNNTFNSDGGQPANAVRASGSGAVVTGNFVDGAAGDGGYSESGILVTGSQNRIGGEATGERNFIGGAGATRPGLHLRGDAVDGGGVADGDGNRVLGNSLGLSPTGASVPNGGPGILVDDDADDNDIGGDPAASSNAIHNSGGDAIEVDGPKTDGTRVLRNTGADNAGLFVDLRPADGQGNGTAVTGANGGVQAPSVIAGGASVRGTAAPGARILIFEKSSPLSGQLGPVLTTTTADAQGRWQTSYSRSNGAIVSVMQVAGRNSSELRQAVVDAVAPQTAVSSGPSGATADSTPTFGLSSSEPSSSFRCRIDNGPLTPCSSPKTVGPLAEGTHAFSVVATDPAGNTDASPAVRGFRVDLPDQSGGGSGGGSGPTPAAILAALKADLKAAARTLSKLGIHKLLRRRGARIRNMDALKAGRLSFSAKAGRTTLLKGSRSFTKAGKSTIRLKLTRAGRRLLGRRRRVRIKLSGTFKEGSGQRTSAARKVRIKRR